MDLEGTWSLVTWRRVAADGTVTHPFGEEATGALTYTGDGRMAVVMTAGGRARMDGDDPLGGEVEQRAALYSTCLAYVGSYEQEPDAVVHHLEESLFPNWSGTEQRRSVTWQDRDLVLRTPPMTGPAAGTVNELVWRRLA